jgi:hypothetical protein
MLRPIEEEYRRRNPGATVTRGPVSGQQYIPPGHPFDRWGAGYGRQMLAAGILDKGVRQPQFGSTSTIRSVSVTRKAQKKEQKKEPVQTPVKAKKKGTTIMAGPLTIESQGGTGTTYRKKLLGD